MLLIEASTKREFHAGVSDAAEAIGTAGGWIVSHQFYSNTLAMISFQMPPAGLPALTGTLATAGITVHSPLPEMTARNGEVAGQLSISFLRDGTDIRRPVPAFG